MPFSVGDHAIAFRRETPSASHTWENTEVEIIEVPIGVGYYRVRRCNDSVTGLLNESELTPIPIPTPVAESTPRGFQSGDRVRFISNGDIYYLTDRLTGENNAWYCRERPEQSPRSGIVYEREIELANEAPVSVIPTQSTTQSTMPQVINGITYAFGIGDIVQGTSSGRHYRIRGHHEQSTRVNPRYLTTQVATGIEGDVIESNLILVSRASPTPTQIPQIINGITYRFRVGDRVRPIGNTIPESIRTIARLGSDYYRDRPTYTFTTGTWGNESAYELVTTVQTSPAIPNPLMPQTVNGITYRWKVGDKIQLSGGGYDPGIIIRLGTPYSSSSSPAYTYRVGSYEFWAFESRLELVATAEQLLAEAQATRVNMPQVVNGITYQWKVGDKVKPDPSRFAGMSAGIITRLSHEGYTGTRACYEYGSGWDYESDLVLVATAEQLAAETAVAETAANAVANVVLVNPAPTGRRFKIGDRVYAISNPHEILTIQSAASCGCHHWRMAENQVIYHEDSLVSARKFKVGDIVTSKNDNNANQYKITSFTLSNPKWKPIPGKVTYAIDGYSTTVAGWSGFEYEENLVLAKAGTGLSKFKVNNVVSFIGEDGGEGKGLTGKKGKILDILDPTETDYPYCVNFGSQIDYYCGAGELKLEKEVAEPSDVSLIETPKVIKTKQPEINETHYHYAKRATDIGGQNIRFTLASKRLNSHGTKGFLVGVSRCAPQDNFSKRIGKEIATKYLEKGIAEMKKFGKMSEDVKKHVFFMREKDGPQFHGFRNKVLRKYEAEHLSLNKTTATVTTTV